MAKCERYQLKITLLADGSLSDDERAAVEAHIAECPSCKAAYEETLGLFGMLKDSRLPEPSQKFMDSLPGKVYDKYNRGSKEKQPYVLRFRRLASSAAVAAALMIIFVSISGFQHKQSPTLVKQALNTAVTPVKPEVAQVFTKTNSNLSTQPETSVKAERNAVDSGAIQDAESEENQLSASFPEGNNDLSSVIESISDDEAKDILESMDQSIQDDNS
jgi:hypothetical protein